MATATAAAATTLEDGKLENHTQNGPLHHPSHSSHSAINYTTTILRKQQRLRPTRKADRLTALPAACLRKSILANPPTSARVPRRASVRESGVPRSRGEGKGRAAEAKAGGSASGKRKAGSVDGEGGGPKKPKIDYASVDRPNTGGDHYRDCAISALQTAFPLIPLPYLRKKLAGKNGLYAPTYLEIRDDEEKVARGEEVRLYKPKKGGGYGGVKGKGKEVRDEVFEEEKRWLDAFLDGGAAGSSSQAQAVNDDQGAGKVGAGEEDDDDDENLVDDGTFVECGCCFSTYPFDRMTTCPDAHLFCRSCLRQYAATELGSQNCVLKCMHTSGCTATFQEPELRRLLPSSLFSLYSRLKQQKELKEAGIEGLEECPFCDWACVIEVSVEVDRLFRCGNEDECGVVSCRMCRKKEHVPKTCKEAEEDKHLGGRVAIEEAMTRALMRRCPKCAKEFARLWSFVASFSHAPFTFVRSVDRWISFSHMIGLSLLIRLLCTRIPFVFDSPRPSIFVFVLSYILRFDCYMLAPPRFPSFIPFVSAPVITSPFAPALVFVHWFHTSTLLNDLPSRFALLCFRLRTPLPSFIRSSLYSYPSLQLGIFLPSDGCNKMTCPNCRQLSCYVCKEAISGYDHFHQNDPRNPGGSSTQTKCPLWDSVDVRHDQEVKEAYQKALEDYKRDHPDVEVDKDLKIDLPKSPPKVPNALPAGYIDPNALAGGWAGGGGGGGWGVVGGGGGWGGFVPAPIPQHLRLEPLEDQIANAQLVAQRARQAQARALATQQRAQRTEQDLQARLLGVEVGGKRRRGVPSRHYTEDAERGFRQQLSAASVERASADLRLDDAERAVARAEEQVRALQQQLRQRIQDLEAWRAQDRQRQRQAQQAWHQQQEDLRVQREEQNAVDRARIAEAARLQRERVLADERARAARRLQQAIVPKKAAGRKKRR
ncbi:hypothetical protein NMY22_g19592 [Coprinellus aureogranulatus]|nr:hypothetical protein NMY22_g19592 [Coprinellus aureogranulatus]